MNLFPFTSTSLQPHLFFVVSITCSLFVLCLSSLCPVYNFACVTGMSTCSSLRVFCNASKLFSVRLSPSTPVVCRRDHVLIVLFAYDNMRGYHMRGRNYLLFPSTCVSNLILGWSVVHRCTFLCCFFAWFVFVSVLCSFVVCVSGLSILDCSFGFL